MKFVDSVKVYAKAGNGGNGCLSFRRERFRPRGGPDGGDAGRGGDVIFVGDAQMTSLLDLSYHPQLIAENGQQGRRNNQSGRNGKDLTVRVPVGTQVIDPETGTVLEDLNEAEKRFVAVRGGTGGRGNAQFASSTNQTPRRAEQGQEGERRWLRLELKLLADVGLVGLPNAGKSTLISRISSASPRVADYPFTTTSPYLGVVEDEDSRNFVVADMPGLIENAHQGCGLGTRFLRHVERTGLLVHVLDATRLPDHSPIEDYQIIVAELKAFSPLLGEKPQIVAINKVDLLETLQPLEAVEREFAERGIRAFSISALRGEGLSPLVSEMSRQLEESRSTSHSADYSRNRRISLEQQEPRTESPSEGQTDRGQGRV
jgi:GTP-binding protein